MAANPLNFVQEAAIMHRIEHENIVRLFGVVLEPKTIMLVREPAAKCVPESILECCFAQTDRNNMSFTGGCLHAVLLSGFATNNLV